MELELSDNHLVGSVPEELDQLKHLGALSLLGNQLSGRLPKPLIRRWLVGSLDVRAEAPLLVDISEIAFESSASAVLCAWHRFVLRSNGSVTLHTERCRNATPDDRTTFCEVRRGQLMRGDFAKLGWLIEEKGFFALRTDYSRGVTHATLETTRVTRDGKQFKVSNYADAGPVELWLIQRAIEGVAMSAEWEEVTTQPRCPSPVN